MAKKKLTPKQVKALVAKEEKKSKKFKGEDEQVFQGTYTGVGASKEQVESEAARVNKKATKVLLFEPKRISKAKFNRVTTRQKLPRITPKTPRLRK